MLTGGGSIHRRRLTIHLVAILQFVLLVQTILWWIVVVRYELQLTLAHVVGIVADLFGYGSPIGTPVVTILGQTIYGKLG